MNNRTFFALLVTLTLAGCMPKPTADFEPEVDLRMSELPFHVDLDENWQLAEDEVIYSWSYGIALEGGVVFVKEPVQGELTSLVDEGSDVYSNADGSIVSFCASGRCLITLESESNSYWATMKDDGLPIIRGEKAIEQIFDNLALD